jgi:conjugal transfer pilus assembly protein TraK
MNIPKINFALLWVVVVSGIAQAQQSASAVFGTPASLATASGSAAFAESKQVGERCERTVSVPCPPKSPRKTQPSTKAAAPKVDRLEVHPDAAIKDTPPADINLPGVMKIAGANSDAIDFNRPRPVDIDNGRSQTVYVSDVDQNRIQLPWVNTKVIGTNELTIDKRPSSNNVYVQFKEGVTRAVQVYFENPNGGSVLGLQLVPKKIIAQTILVRDASAQGSDIKPVKGNDYVASMQSLLEQVALEGVPQGYSQSDLAVGPISRNGVVITPRKFFSSSDKDIYVYEVVNPGPKKITLDEQEFDGTDVLAVSIFPKPVLAVNEQARVIVVSRKASGG